MQNAPMTLYRNMMSDFDSREAVSQVRACPHLATAARVKVVELLTDGDVF